jgi:magnesium-transporting ATPase (P-type)
MSKSDIPTPADFDRKSGRFIRAFVLFWLVLCPTIYWLSGFEFVRSPALGWLVAVIVAGVPIVIIAAAALATFAKVHAFKGKV